MNSGWSVRRWEVGFSMKEKAYTVISGKAEWQYLLKLGLEVANLLGQINYEQNLSEHMAFLLFLLYLQDLDCFVITRGRVYPHFFLPSSLGPSFYF